MDHTTVPPLSLRSFTSLGSFSWTWSIAMIRSPPCTRRNHSLQRSAKGSKFHHGKGHTFGSIHSLGTGTQDTYVQSFLMPIHDPRMNVEEWERNGHSSRDHKRNPSALGFKSHLQQAKLEHDQKALSLSSSGTLSPFHGVALRVRVD